MRVAPLPPGPTLSGETGARGGRGPSSTSSGRFATCATSMSVEYPERPTITRAVPKRRLRSFRVDEHPVIVDETAEDRQRAGGVTEAPRTDAVEDRHRCPL